MVFVEYEEQEGFVTISNKHRGKLMFESWSLYNQLRAICLGN